MSKAAASWSIKGVGFDARHAAEQAARRAGVSVGEWMSQVIADQADEMGVDVEDFGEEDRREAVAGRLARMSGRDDDQHRMWRRARGESPRRGYEDDRDAPRPSRRLRAAEAERLLEDAVEEFERRSARAHGRTAAALASVADRLGDLETRLDEGVSQSGGEVRRTLERLEQRMEALARRASQPARVDDAPRPRREPARAETVAEPVASEAARETPPRPDPALKAIESKLGAILEAMSQPAAVPPTPPQPSRAPQVSSSAMSAALGARPRLTRPALAGAVAEIERRQRDLDGASARRAFAGSSAPQAGPSAEFIESRLDALAARLERVASESARKAAEEAARGVREAARQAAETRASETSPVEPAMRGLQGEIARLADRVEEMRKEARRAAEPRPQPEIDALRQEMASMGRALAALDPAGSVAHLEEAVRDLARRVEHSRADGLSEAVVGPVARLTDELRAQIGALDARPALEGVERAMAEMTQRLEAASRVGASVDRGAIEELRAESGQIRALVEQTLAGAAPLTRLERQIATLGDRLDRLAFATPVVNPPEIAQAIGEIRAMMAAAVPSGSLDALERRIGALADHVERLGEERAPSAHLTETLGEIRSLVGAAAPAGAVQALERQVVGLAERLDRLVAAEPASEPLGEALGEIRSLMSRATAPSAGSQALEKQIAALGDRLDRLAADRGPDVGEAVAEALRGVRSAAGGQDRSFAALESRLDELTRKVEAAARAADVDSLADRVADRLSAVVSESASAPLVSSHHEEALRRLMSDISERVSDLSRPALADAEISALRSEMTRLAERVVRSENESPALSDLTRSMSDLVGRLEAMSESAVDAAERAARSALREAVDQGLVGAGRDQIDALRREQSEAERRASSTLGAVHDTLEKIVDRLAMLEDEVDAGKSVSAPVAPARIRPEPLEEPGDEILGLGRAPAPAHAAPSLSPVALAQDRLIEPSQGRGGADEDEFERRDAASFIAAARRMTQKSAEETVRREIATQAEVGSQSAVAKLANAARAAISRGGDAAAAKAARSAPVEEARVGGKSGGKSSGKQADLRQAAGMEAKAAGAGRKRSILIGLIGLTLAVGALLSVNFTMGGGAGPSSSPTINTVPRVQHEQAAPAAPALATPAPLSSAPAPLGAPAGGPQAAPGEPQRSSALEPLATPGAPPMAAASLAPAPASPVDATATGAINPAPTAAGPSRALKALAESGDAAAQFELGARYAEGRGGLPRDPKAALAWFERSAGQGLAPAQYRLGALYEKGTGTERDVVRAADWYRRAAEAGNARAMHNLAVLTADGAGGKPDYAGAAQWFLKASELGVRDSQYNLAILYARGLGIEQNLALSYTWFATAAKQGDEDAARKRDEVAARLDAKLLEAAKKTAEIFRPKTLDKAANDVAPPPGGWDKPTAAQPARLDAPGKSETSGKADLGKTETGKTDAGEAGKAPERARPLARPKPV